MTRSPGPAPNSYVELCKRAERREWRVKLTLAKGDPPRVHSQLGKLTVCDKAGDLLGSASVPGRDGLHRAAAVVLEQLRKQAA